MKATVRRFLNSNMGYLPFKILEGIFGIVALSLYTSLLSTDVYGNYGIVNTTMMLMYLLSMGWTLFVAIRYVKEQRTDEAKKDFFTNLLTLQGFILLTLLIVYAIFGWIVVTLLGYDLKLILLYVPFFVGYLLSQYYIHLLLYVDRRLMNVILMLLVALVKPLAVYSLYRFNMAPDYVIFAAHGLTDCVLGGIAFLTIRPYAYYDKKYINKQKFREFFHYGFPLIGLTLTMYVLNISDRYIILWFYSKDKVGIYGPNYALASATFLMISYGLSRGFYPKLLDAWQEERQQEAGSILSNAIKNYLFLAVPGAIGLAVLHQDIGKLFIDSNYAEGYPVIGLVAFGMLFLGLAEYMNKEWELTGYTKPIFRNSVKAAIVNVVLNFILVPMFGLIAAAVTTCFSFFVYFIICFIQRKKILNYSVKRKDLMGMLASNVVMILFILGMGLLPLTGLIALLTKIVVAMIGYFVVIRATGVYTLDMLRKGHE